MQGQGTGLLSKIEQDRATLVLREVQALLDSGRAVGAKPLKEYNEVRGYANAARWVYGQALEPDWHDGRLLTLSEIRHIHYTAMTPVWDVAPYPEATDREGPGQFREHDIHPFAEGMTPPSWPLVPSSLQQWAEDVCAIGDRLGRGDHLDHPLPEELARLHPARIVPLAALADREFTLTALRRAAQRGRLDAVQG